MAVLQAYLHRSYSSFVGMFAHLCAARRAALVAPGLLDGYAETAGAFAAEAVAAACVGAAPIRLLPARTRVDLDLVGGARTEGAKQERGEDGQLAIEHMGSTARLLRVSEPPTHQASPPLAAISRISKWLSPLASKLPASFT